MTRSSLALSFLATVLAGCVGEGTLGFQGSTSTTAGFFPSSESTGSGYAVLYRFKGREDGSKPRSSLLPVAGGDFYGTTSAGGGTGCGGIGCGTVFEISKSGREHVIYRFRGGTDGSAPYGNLIDVGRTLIGTTSSGGGCCGTVFELGRNGRERVIYRFRGGKDGVQPLAGLLLANGRLFGTTALGGGTGCISQAGCGTVYEVSLSGKETVIHAFQGGRDGEFPMAALVNNGGALFGTTQAGGSPGCVGISAPPTGCGTVFSVLLPGGQESLVYRMEGKTGVAYPVGALTLLGSRLFGTTRGDGKLYGGEGAIYSLSTSSDRDERVVYRFGGGSDGAQPVAAMTAVNGLLYGTTQFGGGNGCQNFGCGTIFQSDTEGHEQIVYRFSGGADGQAPLGNLTVSNNEIYGTTSMGGTASCDCGVVFRVTLK